MSSPQRRGFSTFKKHYIYTRKWIPAGVYPRRMRGREWQKSMVFIKRVSPIVILKYCYYEFDSTFLIIEYRVLYVIANVCYQNKNNSRRNWTWLTAWFFKNEQPEVLLPPAVVIHRWLWKQGTMPPWTKELLRFAYYQHRNYSPVTTLRASCKYERMSLRLTGS